MDKNNKLNQRINHLEILLQHLPIAIKSEAVMKKMTENYYAEEVEIQFFNHQVKKHLRRQGVQIEDINLAMNFVNQYLKDK
ncbi:hypothetical protein L2735_19225 [Shewanella olleyana]|uniref:hypothetical protein n=1 Tax=Shewanella olleyana TaxID=135626 RepID=UPI0020104041|nr:hypothetical protein [Shewanella olleyana]MCL1068896.1 hypothetical protein [Shewanella olleyana]